MNVKLILYRLWLMYFFIVAIVAINMLLFVAMFLHLSGLLSEKRYRRLADWTTGSTWCFYPKLAAEEGGHKVVYYGMAPPTTDHVLVTVNHIEAPDWSVVFNVALAAGHLQHLKIFAKKSISYVPLIGTGMRAMGTVFLSRSWQKDRKSIETTFAHLRSAGLPYWLMTHPEGTRATPAKLAESQAFAREHDLPVLQHVLLPRTKGLLATLEGLRHDSLESLVDVTLCWEKHPGPLPFYFFGQGGACTIHCHVREFPIHQLPREEADLKKWLYERWVEKDQLVATFRATGSFGTEPIPVSIPPERFQGLRFWKAVTAVITGIFVYRKLF